MRHRLPFLFLAVAAASVACQKEEAAAPAAKTAPAPTPAAARPEPPAPPEPPKADPALVKRGEYLAESVLACATCHTAVGPQGPDMTKRFAGGLEMTEAFGTWRSSNITQDKKTGIGEWTDEQILAAIREGKRPDGAQLYPIMPYMFYNRMSDEDGKAVVAYLRTIAPIENQVAGNTDLKLPKVPAPPPAGVAVAKDDPKYGEYLATMMHCAACHTPMTDKGPDLTKMYAGGMEFPIPPMFGTGVLYAPNLTSDKKTGLGGKYTEEQLVAALQQARRPDGSPIGGPMMMLAPAWAKLEPADVSAVATFILALPPVANKVPKSTFKPAGAPPAEAPAATAKKKPAAPAEAAPAPEPAPAAPAATGGIKGAGRLRPGSGIQQITAKPAGQP